MNGEESTTEYTVPCGICGEPTWMRHTGRCDRCWEVERRLNGMPEHAIHKLIANLVEGNFALLCMHGSDVRVLGLPPVRWNEHATALRAEDSHKLGEVADNLPGLVVHVARAHGYFMARDMNCDHNAAVRNSNEVVAQIRKVLGYTVKKDDLNF